MLEPRAPVGQAGAAGNVAPPLQGRAAAPLRPSPLPGRPRGMGGEGRTPPAPPLCLVILQTESLEDALRQLYVLDAIDVNGAITGAACCSNDRVSGQR